MRNPGDDDGRVATEDFERIERIAGTTEEVEVRRRFDERNTAAARIVTLLLLVVVTVQIIALFAAGERNVWRRGLSMANAAFLLVVLAAFADLHWRQRRDDHTPPRRLVSRYATPAALAFCAIEFLLQIQFTSVQWKVWAGVFPLLAVFFRFFPGQTVLLHLWFMAVSTAQLVRLEGWHGSRPDIIGFGAMNGIMLLGGLAASGMLRRSTTADWRQKIRAAREQLRVRGELQLARALQLSMLPEKAPALPWIELAALSSPASEVGGDYYDYFELGEGRLAIICGDVAGHGVASGLLLSAIRGALILLRDSLHDPALVLARLNEVVAQTSRRRMFVTAAILLLDRHSGSAVVASAGHPPIIVRHGEDVSALEVFAPPLGTRLRPGNALPQRSLALTPGDIFVLHSDGVYEARNPSDEIYGLDRLLRIVSMQPAGATALAIRDGIVHDVERFRGRAAQVDDVTIVVARLLS